MQYLLLIYENEKRFSQGYDEAEMKAYEAFGKEFAKAIKGSNALQPTAAVVAALPLRSRTVFAAFSAVVRFRLLSGRGRY